MRPFGGLIGANPTTASAAINSAAGGIWSLRDAERLKRAGTWPTAFVNPTSLSGLQLWLDAADSGTLFDATTGGSLVAADGGVARWEDKSGNSRHATQGTSANRALRKTAIQNGLDVLRFDGSNDSMNISDFLDLSSGQAITAFVVMKRGATGVSHTLLNKFDRTGDGSTEDGWVFRITVDDKLEASFCQNALYTLNTSNSSITASSFTLLAFKTTAGSFTTSTVLYRNGSVVASSNSGSVQTLDNTAYNVIIGVVPYLGANSDFLNGDIAEIIMYDSALSDANRGLVENYLIGKWGVS